MVKRKFKRGELLVENIIFLVLNVAFLAILVLFLINQGSGASALEDAYSKQVALTLDAGMPGTTILINFQSAKEVSDKNKIPFQDVLLIKDHYVTVKLSDKSGKSYQFFNDINVSTLRPEKDANGNFDGYYFIELRRKV